MRAIIDLGTNTFHLLIVNDKNKVLLKISYPAKLGKGGINEGIITQESLERGINALKEFKNKIDEYEIPSENIFAFGTSAMRNASNREDVVQTILQETGIRVTVISGDNEAELIYEGVKQATRFPDTSLIVDIGGGSVEFIICNSGGLLWKQSVEIGGQRLMELFFNEDPISPASVERLNDHFRKHLIGLANACHQYSPKIMVGSSGSYNTLNMMYHYDTKGKPVPKNSVSNAYPMSAFIKAYEQLITKNREERMAIPGMIEMRVDMIVVAVCLIRYLIQTFGFKEIIVSRYAMKEGIMAHVSKENAS
jgi:exopolyphosphatase/guanosine-5'-triphosphate,3'-diphosphate pyrophosphatase